MEVNIMNLNMMAIKVKPVNKDDEKGFFAVQLFRCFQNRRVHFPQGLVSVSLT